MEVARTVHRLFCAFDRAVTKIDMFKVWHPYQRKREYVWNTRHCVVPGLSLRLGLWHVVLNQRG